MDPDGQWTQVGELNEARQGHKIIYDGQYLLVIGGLLTQSTEKCSIKEGSVSCTSQNPELSNYDAYPELFPISDDFFKINSLSIKV